VTCKWCGCTTDATSHGTVTECIEALEREIEALRRVLEKRPEKPTTTPSPHVLPWKKSRAG
jgi:coproporphyrinogen III oxidase-like Fe-S oxidoreductase